MRQCTNEEDVYPHGHCSFSMETLGLIVYGEKKDAPFNVPESRDAIETFPVFGRYAHELDHLYRGIGTSWGLTCHVLLGRVLQSYLWILGEFDLTSELKGMQFSELLRQSRRHDSVNDALGIDRSLLLSLRTLASEYELRRALLGFRPHCPKRSVIETLNRVFGCGRESQPNDNCFPELQFQGHFAHELSAYSIVEGLATLKESIFAVDNLEARDSEVLLSAEKSNSQYVVALDIGRSKLRSLFNWEYQPIELEAALNLALWVPISPDNSTTTSQFHWNDVEVGHRYLRILEWVKRKSKPLTCHTSLESIERDNLFRQFFDTASNELGWPSPFKIAEDWRKHFRRSRQGTRTNFNWWCFGEKRLRTSFAQHLLSEFQDHPYYCWFISSKFQALERATFTYVQYDDVLEFFSQHIDSDGRKISARIEAYIFVGMQILLGIRRFTSKDSDIISNHRSIVPLFFGGTDKGDLVSRNLDHLVKQTET